MMASTGVFVMESFWVKIQLEKVEIVTVDSCDRRNVAHVYKIFIDGN